jgi:hypothetical protein
MGQGQRISFEPKQGISLPILSKSALKPRLYR